MDNGNMPANVVTEEQWDRSSSAAPAIGLTKREHFAGLAMQGYLAARYCDLDMEDIAEAAIDMADVLLKEISK